MSTGMWRHLVCGTCWLAQNGGHHVDDVGGDVVGLCCFCGRETSSGIYTRADPREVACKGTTGIHPKPDAEGVLWRPWSDFGLIAKMKPGCISCGAKASFAAVGESEGGGLCAMPACEKAECMARAKAIVVGLVPRIG
jgi:hypothetical protein